MPGLIVTVASASALFVGTNLDDIVVLAALNASSRTEGRPRSWHIWTGQVAGMAVLVGVSWLAALGLTLVPEHRTWPLGLVPIGLGAYKLLGNVRARRRGEHPRIAVATGLPGVVGVTVANGGDNIAAYTPVFRTSSGAEIATIVVVFGVGVVLWCTAGSWLVSHQRVIRFIERWGHWVVPTVFVGIGAYIFCKAGATPFP
jgi:cadmium resistance protein CadD (predicted permease)